MLVLPRIGSPASLRRRTTVASYGGIQPSRIFEPQVVGRPSVASTSLTATGTPSRRERMSPVARRSSESRAAASAPSASTCRNACTSESTAAIRSRNAWVISTLVVSPAPSTAARSDALRVISAALIRGPRGKRSEASIFVGCSLLVPEDAGHGEALVLDRRGTGQRLLRGEARSLDVLAEHVGDRDRVRGRRDVLGGDLVDGRDRLQDHRQLRSQVVELGVVEV